LQKTAIGDRYEIAPVISRDEDQRSLTAAARRWLVSRGAIVSSSIRPNLGRVTVAEKPGDDVAPGTLNSILKQANLKQ
jgi:hypothetical protein